METVIRFEGKSELCEDRAEVIAVGSSHVIALADGAGGVPGGARAAQIFIEAVRNDAEQLVKLETSFLAARLSEISTEIADDATAGETTAILAIIEDDCVRGVSAGDSEAWIFSQDGNVNLTARQAKSRRLGTAEAVPVVFEATPLDGGTLVVGSDGLWNFAPLERIAEVVQWPAFDRAADQLVDAVRSRSGVLEDDVAVVLCRSRGTTES